MQTVSLRVFTPICSFRKPYAREYLETHRIPPPSTAYGFLLSLVGEEERETYKNTRIAIAITQKPSVSTILRTAWRVKDKKKPLGTDCNKTPDFKEILTGLEIGIWVDRGKLAERLLICHKNPEGIERYGGLCLGESCDLVDEVEFYPKWDGKEGEWLVNDPEGFYPLPIWVDHVGSKGTLWGQFSLKKGKLEIPNSNNKHWIKIHPPTGKE